jgi:hypothetical protein
MKMHNPPHPGEVLKTLCLEPLNLSITDAARSLGREPQDSVQHSERACRHQPRDGGPSLHRLRHQR